MNICVAKFVIQIVAIGGGVGGGVGGGGVDFVVVVGAGVVVGRGR